MAAPVGTAARSRGLGGVSRIHVNFGLSVDPYFVWTMLFPVDAGYKLKTSDGFIHVSDDGSSKTFYNVSQTSCTKPHASIPCADFSLVIVGSQLYVQVIFKTTVNGHGAYF